MNSITTEKAVHRTPFDQSNEIIRDDEQIETIFIKMYKYFLCISLFISVILPIGRIKSLNNSFHRSIWLILFAVLMSQFKWECHRPNKCMNSILRLNYVHFTFRLNENCNCVPLCVFWLASIKIVMCFSSRFTILRLCLYNRLRVNSFRWKKITNESNSTHLWMSEWVCVLYLSRAIKWNNGRICITGVWHAKAINRRLWFTIGTSIWRICVCFSLFGWICEWKKRKTKKNGKEEKSVNLFTNTEQTI